MEYLLALVLLIISGALLYIWSLVDKARADRELNKMREEADWRRSIEHHGFFGDESGPAYKPKAKKTLP